MRRGREGRMVDEEGEGREEEDEEGKGREDGR